MADPWAAFRGAVASAIAPDDDQWAAFRQAKPVDTGDSGDEIRARNAGDTRAQMRLPDIEAAYDIAAQRGDRPEQQAMARAYVQRERADSPTMMGISDRVRAFARGVPVLGGIADEVNAGLNSIMPGQNYEKALDYQRARDAVFDEANPGKSLGFQVGGGLLSGVGLAGTVGPLLSATPRAIALGTGLGGGATLGAVDGFTRGEDGLGSRAQNAVVGGAIGGAVGAAAPVVGKGINAVAQALVDSAAVSGARRALGLSKGSADILTRTLEADGTLGPRGLMGIRSAGSSGMVADAGPNAAAVLDTAIQRGGAGSTAARDAVEGRSNQAASAVTQALDQALGQPRGITSVTTALREGSAPARDAAYRKAYDTPIDYARPEAMDLLELLKRVPNSAISKANELMKIEGVKSKQIMAKIAEDGTVTYERLPDVRQLDYITRGLKQIADEADGAGKLGGTTDIGRAIGNLSRQIRGTTKALVPEYATALETAAGPIEARNALQLGSKALSPTMARDTFAEAIDGMSKPELAHVKQGIRSNIDEALANVKRTVLDPNTDAREAVKAIKDLSSQAVREKVNLVLGKEEASDLFQKIDEAAKAFDLRARVTENSKTFARMATNDAAKTLAEPGPLGMLMEGSPVKAGRGVVQALLGTGPKARQAKEDQMFSEVVRALTERRGSDAEAFVRQLADANRRKGLGGQLGNALGVLGGGALAGSAYPAIYQQTTPPRR